MTILADLTLTCADCGAQFVFTVGEQSFYAERGFTQAPRRCKDCRQQRKAVGRKGDGERKRPEKQSHAVNCSECGAATTVPFRPDPSRPVFCRDCLAQRRGGR